MCVIRDGKGETMLTLFSQEEVWDMHIRRREKAAAEKAVKPILETMKNTVKRMLEKGKLQIEEVLEYFPNLTQADMEDIEKEMLQKV